MASKHLPKKSFSYRWSSAVTQNYASVIFLFFHLPWNVYKSKLFRFILRRFIFSVNGYKNQNNKNRKIRKEPTFLCKFAIFGFIMKNCGFAISGLAHVRNVMLSDGGISHRNYGLAVCRLKKLACPPLLQYCKKKVTVFPVLNQGATYQTFPGRE